MKQYLNTFVCLNDTVELLWAKITFESVTTELVTTELVILTRPSAVSSGFSFSSSRNCFNSRSENYFIENGVSI